MIRFPPRATAIAAAVIILPTVAGCGYNTIPTREEAAKARWADVQSQYQRRADLIPNLVSTVQGAKTLQSDAERMQLFSAAPQAQTAPTVSFDGLAPAVPGGAAPPVTPGTTPAATPAP